MEELTQAIKILKKMSANDLFRLQSEISKYIYAKGVEDHIKSSDIYRALHEK